MADSRTQTAHPVPFISTGHSCQEHSVPPSLAMTLRWLVILFASAVRCYPNGAPPAACRSMEPEHYFPAQTGPSPFRILPLSDSIDSNQVLQVQLQGDDHFKGYLLMALDASGASEEPLGTFVDTSDGKVVDCSSGASNAVTHSNAGPKTDVSIRWIPPSRFNGSVVFRATFVHEFSVFWVAQDSTDVEVVAVDGTTGNEQTTTSVGDPQTTGRPAPSIYGGCGQDKGCFGTPAGCVDSGTCSMMVTYVRKSAELMQLEIYGQASAGSYVAVAFSKDNLMGDDSVIECVVADDQIDAHVSFNVRGANQRLPPDGLYLVQRSYEDGYLSCQVQRQSNFTANGLLFDLTEPHFLLLARGAASADGIEYHSSRVASQEAVSLDEFTSPESSGASVWKKLHGSFMTSAWLLTGSIATFLPRYMKKTWVGKQLLGKDLWFFLHRGMMVKVWILTVVAFVIIFVDVGGWVSQPIGQNPHALIGCFATGLAFVQPFMAALRPTPDAPRRYIFNWAHAVVGYSAHALAVTCIYLAVEMEAANLPFCTYWLLAAHTCVYLSAQLILTLLSIRTRRLLRSGYTKSGGDEPGSSARRYVLASYSVLVVSLTAAVLVFIALGRQIAC